MFSARISHTTKRASKHRNLNSNPRDKHFSSYQGTLQKSRKRFGKGKRKSHGLDRSLQVAGINGKDINKIYKVESRLIDENAFWPNVVFGDEPKGLSRIERADLRIFQWESILKTHKEKLPAAVPTCQAILTHARDDRKSLRANPTNNIIMDETKRKQVVQDRIQVLKNTLSTAEFEPERVNIRGAIAAYILEEIVYSKLYTLIWGGKVVERADSYGEFTEDRLSRLDRYAEKYGPHWLWWESPLWLEPSQQIVARGCQIIHKEASPTVFGQFYINQGFHKRSGWVTRMPQNPGSGFAPPSYQANFAQVGNSIYCQDAGPKLLFRSLLDSGASYPSLFRADFEALGISPKWYGAQSVVTMITSNGTIDCRVYEMHVEIAGNSGTPIIDPEDPLQPAFPNYIGGLSPVVLDEGIQGVDENGIRRNERLSGVMPFLASYVSTTPGSNTIFMGENRNDVLGASKMPPQRRWLVNMAQDLVSKDRGVKFDDPLITFRHRNGTLVDQDVSRRLTKLTLHAGLPNEKFHIFDAKRNRPRPNQTHVSIKV